MTATGGKPVVATPKSGGSGAGGDGPAGGNPGGGGGGHRPAPAILFTAFEPSGDAHAAAVIEELRHRSPQTRVFAWGGPKMQEAGATIIEQTVGDAAMGLNALKKIASVKKQVSAIKRWSKIHRVVLHVAVDSPAANFPICKIMKKRGAKVVHLVAPQLWAWGAWRVKKLRRLTDLVLCLLPFEQQWFTDRKIPALFIGHPRVNRQIDEAAVREKAKQLPTGTPRIAILPGSRPHEVRANISLLASAYTELHGRHHSASGVICAANQELAEIVRKKIKMFPTGLHLMVSDVEPVLYWCELALAVSGTVTLDVARFKKPMVGVYKTGLFEWFMAKLLIRSKYRLLPNVIARREVSPEFVPYVGGSMKIVEAATPYLQDSKKAATQSEHLARILTQYAHKKPAIEAAKAILDLLGEKEVARPSVEKTNA